VKPLVKDSYMPRVKICCIASVDEARMALAAGASALGLVSQMPSGPGVISEALIAQIAATVSAPTDTFWGTFLLTCQQDAQAIVAQHRVCRTSAVQLVDSLGIDQLQQLRDALPGIKLVQVVHVTGSESVKQAQAVAAWVDAVLLDSGNPKLPVKELGGTGRTHDWTLSRQIVQAVQNEAGKPVWLAGGLNAANVAQAVRQVQPYGLDLCSSVRTDGALDANKLAALFAALRAG
jgi:phosphoribosylanthranilate isomerase